MWTKDFETNLDSRVLALMHQLQGLQKHNPQIGVYIRQSEYSEHIVSRRLAPQFLTPLLRIPDGMKHARAILVRRPLSWPSICPSACLIIFDWKQEYESEEGLRELASRVIQENQLYVINGGYGLLRLGSFTQPSLM